MAKIAVSAAAALCFAALVAVAVGQGEVERQRLRDLQCWQEVQESPLDACRQVLERQLTGGGMGYGFGPFRWGTGLRMRCCQQLQDVSPECRCAAIRSMVRDYEVTMPPLEKGWWGRRRRQPQPQGGQGYDDYPCSQPGEGGYGYGEGGQQPMYPPCRPGTGSGSTGPRIGRVRLTKARQYAAGMPMMCRLSEPQECSVFSGGDQYY